MKNDAKLDTLINLLDNECMVGLYAVIIMEMWNLI